MRRPNNNKYVTQAKENTPFTHGSSPQQNAQGIGRARATKQQDMNRKYRGGRVPDNYGISPDSPAQGYSPYPTFATGGLSPQNSNSASKNGNNNLAVGTENQKYDICATNPSAAVCAGTGITQTLPKPKGGSSRGKRSRTKKRTKRKMKRTKGKRAKRRTKKRTLKRRKNKK